MGEERSGRERKKGRIYTQKPTTELLITFDSSSDEQESVLQWKWGVTLEMKHTLGARPPLASHLK